MSEYKTSGSIEMQEQFTVGSLVKENPQILKLTSFQISCKGAKDQCV